MGVPRRTRKFSNTNMSLGVRRLGEERFEKLDNHPTRNVGSLPRDLLVDVLARVASSSFTDLFNAKLSCKGFLESTTDDYISELISIDKFPITHWFPPSTRMLSFLTHCFNKGNSESLFRQGMIDYFMLVKVEPGLEYLKSATVKGHAEATYVYGMILLSSGDKFTQQGLDLLNSMNDSKSGCWNLQDSRAKIKLVLSQLWINYNPVNLEEVKTKCAKQDHAIRFAGRGWSLDEDEEISSCDTCLWYRELTYFCKIMNVIV